MQKSSKFKVQSSKLRKGFTLVEVIIVMSIMAALIGLITINLANSQQRASLTSLTQTFVSDLSGQQIKAMIGDSEGRSSSDSYGVHIDTNQYVLFHGVSYSSGDASNFKVILPANMQFVVSGQDIIFARLSGEISLASSVQLKDTTNSNTKTVQINQYGVVTGVN